VLDPFHVDRGYADLPDQLRSLGADVHRVPAAGTEQPGSPGR
jgi:UDP-N-acetylglucosamine enolpyruvyl transferase